MNLDMKIEELKTMISNKNSFIAGAGEGQIRQSGECEEGQTPRVQIGSGQTPVSRGLVEGYSPEDIAYFYIARELGSSWLAHLNVAFKDFCHDVKFEERYAGPEMFCCNHLKEEEVMSENKLAIVEAYLCKCWSQRKIQKQIMKIDAPERGGGYEAMNVLHSFGVKGEHKGILKNKGFDKELFRKAQSIKEYLSAHNL